MDSGTKIAWDDTVLPFQLDNSNIRGRFVRLDGVLDQVLTQHDYPPQIEALVAEATLLTALIGQSIKLRWKLSLQIRGDGPVKLIATDYYAASADGEPAQIRAYADYDASKLDPNVDPYAQIDKGYFGVLIDQGPDMTPYQGITPISGNSLSECAQTYFAQSEQLPTRFTLLSGRSQTPGQPETWRAGGIMLQTMPAEGGTPSAAPDTDPTLLSADDLLQGDESENWNRANILLDTVEELEMIGPSVTPTQLLLRLFHEEAPRVFDVQSVAFGCTCSEERVRESLATYGGEDLAEMVTDDGRVTADCQFCGAHYDLDPASLGIQTGDVAKN